MQPEIGPRVLLPLPPSLWESWEVRRARAESPGAVIAAARRAYGLRQDELGAMAGFSQSAISRLEAGGNLAFDTRVLRNFQALLGIPAQLLGIGDPEPGPTPVPASGHGLDTDVLLMLHVPAAVSGVREVDAEVMHQLLVARQVVNDLDDWIVCADLLVTVRRLYELVDRLRTQARGGWREHVLNVAALYAEFCAWLHLETGDLAGANSWTTRALQQAQAVDDRELVSYTYRRMSQLAQLEGDDERALGLARAAARESGVGPRIYAMALQQEARCYARLGADAACLSTLDKAYALVDGYAPDRGEEYRLASWFSVRHVEMERADCCVELGRLPEAVALHEAGLPRWSPGCRWVLGVHFGKMATAHARLGDFERAAAAGTRALALANGTGCQLITSELRRLRTWARNPAIVGIVDALGPDT